MASVKYLEYNLSITHHLFPLVGFKPIFFLHGISVIPICYPELLYYASSNTAYQ